MVTKHGFDLVKSAYRFTEIPLFEPVKLAGPEGLSKKKLQNLDPIQSEAGPKDTILLEALKRRFQFEKRHR
jgi:hypothetical protein